MQLARVVGRPLLIALLLCVFGLWGATPVSASAARRTSLAWRFVSPMVDSGVAAKVLYQVAGLPDGSALEVQQSRSVGWTNLVEIPVAASARGRITLPVLDQGRYDIRIVAERHGSQITRSGSRVLLVFAHEPMSRILGTTPATTTIGNDRFRYAWSASHWTTYTLLNLATSSCRSFSLQLAYVNPSAAIGQTATMLSVIQRTRTRVLKAPNGTIQLSFRRSADRYLMNYRSVFRSAW